MVDIKGLYVHNKIIRVLLNFVFGIVIAVVVVIICVFLFLKLWRPFGATSSKLDKENYEKRSINYKDGIFHNENDFQMMYEETEENLYLSDKGLEPMDNIPVEKPNFSDRPGIEELNITWLGHSFVIMQMHGMNILIDPIFNKTSSPVSFFGPSRFSDLAIKVEELPYIDIAVISHDHYDHLDYKTIKEIDNKVGKYVVPLGIENHLERWGVNETKIVNLAWWEETNVNGLLIGCTPARHYSGRSLNDRYNTLWASWVFVDDYHKVYESGDSGFDKHFEEIYMKYGEFDFAMLDCGQYNVRWRSTHMMPEESVEAGKILKARVIMPIHWGGFSLSTHPWDDPIERFTSKAEEENMTYVTPILGKTFKYSVQPEINKWWKNIN